MLHENKFTVKEEKVLMEKGGETEREAEKNVSASFCLLLAHLSPVFSYNGFLLETTVSLW